MGLYNIENEFIRLEILSVGASIYRFIYKPTNTNIVLTSQDQNAYMDPKNSYFGATVGPVAGRIKDGKFIIDGVTYHATQNEKETNSLHGGFDSFAFKEFKVIKRAEDKILFEYTTSKNEGGYPGVLSLKVLYVLIKNKLNVTYQATTTAPTIINITNHSYFNLDGEGRIVDHKLQMNAKGLYRIDEKQINIDEVEIEHNSLFDFEKAKFLGPVIRDQIIMKKPTMGIDHLFIVPSRKLKLVGQTLKLEIKSNYPAFQLYSTNFPHSFPLLTGENPPLFAGLAIEPVDVVSSLNGEFKHLELRPKEKYSRSISYKISLK